MKTKVTPEDFKRDLMMDLLLAEAATPGPWVYIINGYGEGRVGPAEPRWGDESVGQAFWLTSSVWVMSGSDEARASNTKFVAAAREGWPAAIRLAMHWQSQAEAEKAEREACHGLIERALQEVGYVQHSSRPGIMETVRLLVTDLRRVRGQLAGERKARVADVVCLQNVIQQKIEAHGRTLEELMALRWEQTEQGLPLWERVADVEGGCPVAEVQG